MSNVVLSIGGRTFSVACADGEEEHIGKLGEVIDAKVQALGNSAGQNEVRMLLYAALVLADELHEAAAAMPRAPVPSKNEARPDPGQLPRIADALEKLADDLERGAQAT